MVSRVEIEHYIGQMSLDEATKARLLSALRDPVGGSKAQQPEMFYPKKESSAKKIRLFIAEEQQILREAYQAFFKSHPIVELMASSDDTSSEALLAAEKGLKPSVMLIGVKTLQPATMEKLEAIREACSDLALVLLSAFYDLKGIKALRQFSRGTTAGCAYLLKHTVDTVEQLTQVIYSVSEGRIILDPSVMEGLIASGEPHGSFLKELSPRELEVLSWMAKGYRNQTIAELLFVEPKTVERHINSIYSKLGNSPESMHSRIYAVMLYLKATGLLSSQPITEG